MGWIKSLVNPKARQWEEFYRNRWQHDNITRSTHGVNCTGGCSWMVFVKDGIITWEMQATDYPLLEPSLPPYEPRGCQRGISASWYVYSPIRVKYPYMRGPLMDFWREARAQHSDPIQAWASIVQDEQKRHRWQRARGKGGFRRATWDECLELVASSLLYTAKKYGPDRVVAFAPIPAYSYLSFGAGTRFIQLFGGFTLSFYDWYADLPNSFPEVWGDQTDVCESADWYNSKFIVSNAANLNMTRTADVHFVSEARHNGTKFVVIAPDFSQVAKYSDWWIPVKAGQDQALWMGADHVILKEFYIDRQVPYFIDYQKRYTDGPMLVKVHQTKGGGFTMGQFLRANRINRYKDVENGNWQLLVWDKQSGPRLPKGCIGYRWAKKETGKWNITMEDAMDNTPLDPLLSFLGQHDAVAEVEFDIFGTGKVARRGVPIKYLETSEGKVAVTTAFDLLLAQFAVGRPGLTGDYPKSYDDDMPYTPAWQEAYTGIGRDTVIRFAREFAGNAEATQGRSMVITGASLNHWYNNGLCYRGPITALILTGCCGRNGGGLNHYVGQEKLTLVAAWSCWALGKDWVPTSRLQQSSSWHYAHSDQWRYEGDFTEYAPIPRETRWAKGHAMDLLASAVRMGWMPSYPQFNRNPFEVVKQAEAAGAKTDEQIVKWVVEQVKSKQLKFAIEDVDAPENWPRTWLIWRGNALQSSAKGAEFFLRHYLGTHDNAIAEEHAKGRVKDVTFREPAPRGKMDLLCQLNFRMDTTATYCDVVLPTAFWYEKNDLNTTDLHTFIHPLGAATPPAWESKTDYEIFKAIAKKVSELAPSVFQGPVKDIVMQPLAHDTPDELSQDYLAEMKVLDWGKGEVDLIPGKTAPHFKIIERDYANLYNQWTSFGPKARENGIVGNGEHIDIKPFYDELLENPIDAQPDVRHMRCRVWGGQRYPGLEFAEEAANLLLHLSPESNGEVSYHAFKEGEHQVGLPLADLAEGVRGVRMTYFDLTRQVRRTLISPCWTGMVNDGRAYAAWCLNVERLIPWRTLSGRQHHYMDHPYYIDYGEQLMTHKPKLDPRKTGDIVRSPVDDESVVLNYITPHGKWHIHSTYYDNHRLLTLSRGIEPCWLNDKDAARIGVKDNDWVEVYNDNGVMVTRAAVSARVQMGTCMIYHAPERTISIPKSQVRGNRRGGAHNSLTRIRINPMQMAGGYAQWTYAWNYWGPIGIMTRDTHVAVRKLSQLVW